MAQYAVGGRSDEGLVTFRRRFPKAPTTFSGMSDSRLDAQARLGDLAEDISNLSFWMLEQIVHLERKYSEVASSLREDERYVSARFREALTDAAAHYRMCSPGTPG